MERFFATYLLGLFVEKPAPGKHLVRQLGTFSLASARAMIGHGFFGGVQHHFGESESVSCQANKKSPAGTGLFCAVIRLQDVNILAL